MKKKIFVGILIAGFLLFLGNISYGYRDKFDKDVKNTSYTKEDLYQIVSNKRVDYKNQEVVYILCNWYKYFDKEELFMTQEEEYVDYVTYEIYRVHLENMYDNEKKKILKKLLRYGNFPRQEDSEKYDKYIIEYKKTTGKDI